MNEDPRKENPSRLIGNFTTNDDQSVVGELRLDGQETILKLHSNQIFNVTNVASLDGLAYSGEALTLIDCLSPGIGRTMSRANGTQYHANVFPHFVTAGQHHLKHDQHCISAIEFTTTDIATLFYDFDAFGSIVDAGEILDAALREQDRTRPLEFGEAPLVQYFTGKDCIVEADTDIGKISVHHRPSFNMGDSTGVYIKNNIVVSVKPNQPVSFFNAIERMYETASFLSMVAGRPQGVNNIRIVTTEVVDEFPQSLSVYPSYPWQACDKTELHEPHPSDIPLDPIRHSDEFKTVLSDWINRHSSWRVARARYLGCLRKTNKYDSERLVAAANMFDLLPEDAVPPSMELDKELAATRDASVDMFRKHPAGIDRDAALSVLGRLGRPSLPKKVKHRVMIVNSRLGDKLEDLQFVASVAIKCRNYFVHGSSGDIQFDKVERLVPFLTDALEFIFATSDLIDAGWDAQRWHSGVISWGHSFARFRSEYELGLAGLREATNPSR